MYKYFLFSFDTMIKMYHVAKDNMGIYRIRDTKQFDCRSGISYISFVKQLIEDGILCKRFIQHKFRIAEREIKRIKYIFPCAI